MINKLSRNYFTPLQDKSSKFKSVKKESKNKNLSFEEKLALSLKSEKKDKEKELKKLKELSYEFQSIFIHQLIRSMRKTVPKNGLFYGGFAEDIFQDMLDEEYSKILSKNGNFELAQIIYKELSKNMK